MNKLILTLTIVLTFTFGASFLQAASVGSTDYCRLISEEISVSNSETNNKLMELQYRYMTLCSSLSSYSKNELQVEQYVDCNTLKADAIHFGLDVETLFNKCKNFKIQECDDEMLASEDLAQAQFQFGDEAELANRLAAIYAQNKDCKAKIK